MDIPYALIISTRKGKMNVSVRHTYPIDISIKSSKGASSNTPSTTEPFTAGRATPRLLFDFGVMASLMNPQLLHKPVLDFGTVI